MDKNINTKSLSLKAENERIRNYFNTCMPSINSSNRYMLRKVCVYISMVYLALLILALFMVPGFKITIAYYLMVPFVFIFFVINFLTRKIPNISTLWTSIMCLSFYFWLHIIFIMMDVVSSNNQQALWFPLMLMIFPALFIDKMYKYGIEELILVIIFCVFSYNYKPYDLFLRDTYLGIAAYVSSMLSAHILLDLRSHQGLAIDELTRVSTIDSLTNSLNKGAFLETIDNYYDKKITGEPCAMCVIDVDNFKQVNDSLGHNAGDRLLKHIGDLLRENFRSTDIIGRFGGDEFIVFMPGAGAKDLVEARCRRMQEMLADFNIGNTEPFSLSIGVIVDLGDHPSNKLFRMTDDALYESKLLGKNRTTAWVVNHRPPSDKPLMLLVSNEDSKAANRLAQEESSIYDVLRAYNGSDALLYLSQYHGLIRLMLLELDINEVPGEEVLKYAKQREGFDHIPIIAVASSEDDFINARLLGADRVFMLNSPDDDYKNAIKNFF
ncbi:MAG: diguanylate cyclase [Butyrivibrio sp.]|nr:diguanylate cyclase [Butyrivibrio sp.]